ncbi:MAG: ornithine carbamoyltransferase [Deltaproteobacteria bacterium]|nr:ornithine carbamoyltransferase [Myxococcales bacterium]MDP3215279.1 ornithine carbamoyltransferase [Deltaproteobacteria bacterium]
MTPKVKRDFLRVADLGADELRQILEHAKAMKNQRRHGASRRPLEGRSVALIFEKPSTRTRVSFEVGAFELGAHPVVLNTRDMQLGRGESIGDTARTLSRYVHAIVLRTAAHERIEALAAAATVPVINALTDDHHPCQILADLMTVRERKGALEGLRYAWIGDANNVARSWVEAAGGLGLTLTVASPEGYGFLSAELPPGVQQVVDPREAARGADVVITDVWASMGQEGDAAARHAAFAGYQVDAALMGEANPNPLLLHCLPAHRGEEVEAALIDDPGAAVWDEAENRLHAQKALLEFLMR